MAVLVILFIHNAAQKAGSAFSVCCGFDAEEFAIDLYYWFDKSTNQKNDFHHTMSFVTKSTGL